MKKTRIRLTLRSYDHKLLDEAIKQIALAGRRTGARVVGPIPLPNKRRIFTVLRSPHVNKKSREQFQLIVHKRVLDILSPAEQTIEALSKLSLSAGVDVDIR